MEYVPLLKYLEKISASADLVDPDHAVPCCTVRTMT